MANASGLAPAGVVAGLPDVEPPAVSAMRRFNDYVTKHYEGGSERFFSPTGFLDEFQKSVELKVADVRNHVFVRDIDQAVRYIEPVLHGSAGVFDLTSEPGTGKTSVLPFRFPTKKVVVALPTPFDAWSAFQMATGTSRLRIKGLTLGSSSESAVVYTDSYMAAKALLSGYLDYDVMIVDECDSARGVTKFLAEVKAPGKLLIRMSASHGRSDSGPSRSFQVAESESMPDVRSSMAELASYVEEHHVDRSLVLLPDADAALQLGGMLSGSVVVCAKSNLVDIAKAMVRQEGPGLFVADDVCARGLNLNISDLFDTQLISEFGVVRAVTSSELMQRKGRVGRNKAGRYYSPGLGAMPERVNDLDVVRQNVVRAVAGVRQLGHDRLMVDRSEARTLMYAVQEPYYELASFRADALSKRPTEPVVESLPVSPASRSSSVSTGSASAPTWLSYFSAGELIGEADGKVTYVAKDRKGRKSYVRSKHRLESFGSDDRSSVSSSSSGDALAKGLGALKLRNNADRRKGLPLAVNAPYAADPLAADAERLRVSVPMAPPVMDLNELTYDMNWPALVRDRLMTGLDLPTLVPHGSWRHTSSGGIGTSWFARLEHLAVSDNKFDDAEFEVVCRAWNLLVGQAWVRKSPGLSSEHNLDRLEYCARYFQSYYMLQSAGH